jgi:hypothetical protein
MPPELSGWLACSAAGCGVMTEGLVFAGPEGAAEIPALLLTDCPPAVPTLCADVKEPDGVLELFCL